MPPACSQLSTTSSVDRLLREEPGRTHETDEHVTRSVPVGDEGWTAVVWTDLDEANADALIAEQVARFAGLGRRWEWKYYSYDRPADLPERLVAAGFVPEPVETLLVAEIADLPLDVPPPPRYRAGRRHRRGRSGRPCRRARRGVRRRQRRAGAGAARTPRRPAHHGGGRRGLCRRRPRSRRAGWSSITARSSRASGAAGPCRRGSAVASSGRWSPTAPRRPRRRGSATCRWTPSDESRPILERLGFVPLAQTTPFIWSPPDASGSDA